MYVLFRYNPLLTSCTTTTHSFVQTAELPSGLTKIMLCTTKKNGRKYHRDVKICKENHPQLYCIFNNKCVLKLSKKYLEISKVKNTQKSHFCAFKRTLQN